MADMDISRSHRDANVYLEGILRSGHPIRIEYMRSSQANLNRLAVNTKGCSRITLKGYRATQLKVLG